MSGDGHGERLLRRNVIISALGVAARGAQLALLFGIGRWLGADVLGQFLLGFGLYEIALAVVATGLTDGTTLLVSRRADHARDHGDDGLARVVATGLAVGGGMAAALALGATAAAAPLAHVVTGAYRPLLPALPWLAWALVPTAVSRVAFAACTGFLRLEWEAIVGGAGPALGMALALPLVRAAGGGARGLFAALLVVQIAMAVLALAVLSRWLGGARLRAALRGLRPDRALLAFAIPQGVNMALTTYVGRVDLAVLATGGVPPATVGVYGAVAAVVRELRQTRMIVSAALAPLVARYDAAGDRAAIARALSRSARGVASLAVPLALGLAVLRQDLLGLLAPGYAGRTGFVLVLLAGALINCLGGLSGNFLVYLLRNRWNLANAAAGAAAGSGLGWLLVPRLGLAGAALASTAAIALVTLLENVELALLERVHIGGRALAPALAALGAGAGLAWAAARGLPADGGLAWRVALAVTMVVLATFLARRGPPDPPR
jgi:O-antigen/teichoic acid export membrane protein